MYLSYNSGRAAERQLARNKRVLAYSGRRVPRLPRVLRRPPGGASQDGLWPRRPGGGVDVVLGGVGDGSGNESNNSAVTLYTQTHVQMYATLQLSAFRLAESIKRTYKQIRSQHVFDVSKQHINPQRQSYTPILAAQR